MKILIKELIFKLLYLIPSTLLLLFLLIGFIGWNGETVERDIYEYDTLYQCNIEEEWLEVDYWKINLLSSDWYRTVSGEKIFVQGNNLQCSKQNIETFTETELYYRKGLKDYLLFRDMKKEDSE